MKLKRHGNRSIVITAHNNTITLFSYEQLIARLYWVDLQHAIDFEGGWYYWVTDEHLSQASKQHLAEFSDIYVEEIENATRCITS